MRRSILFIVILSGLLLPTVTARQSPPLPINYGQTVTGELNDVQQAIQYLFDARAGDSITILMSASNGDLNPFLVLATFEGDTLAENDDDGGETNAFIEFEIPAEGTYVITATRSRSAEVRGAGEFELSLNAGSLPLETTPEAIPLEVGARLQKLERGVPIQAALTREEAFSLFWFEGAASEEITLRLDPSTPLQALVVLYNAGFTELVRNRPNTPLTLALPAEGIYFVAVGLPDAQSEGGNYGLTLTGANTPPREVQPGQNPIVYGESVRGTISSVTISYTFRFSGRAGDAISATMTRAGGDLDSFLFLLDSGGVTIAQDDNSGSNNADAILRYTLPVDGEYLLLATRKDQSAGTTTGDFLLNLASDAPPIVATTPPSSDKPANLVPLPEIAIGQTQRGTISDSSFLSAYVFRGEEGDEIVAQLNSTSTLDPYLILLDENQAPLAENDDVVEGENQNSEISYTLPRTGYYVLVATRFEQDQGETEGSFELTLRQKAGNEALDSDNQSSLIRRLEANPIIPATTPSDSFDPLTFANIYSFGITDPASLIDFSVTTDSHLATTVILADENLQVVAVSDIGTLLGVALPATGNYVVMVAPAAGPALNLSENYVLAFNATGEVVSVPEEETTAEPEAPLQSLTYDESVEGEITETINAIRYVFSGLEGDTIRIRMSAGGSGLDPLVRLYNSDEDLLEENDDIVAGEQRDSLLQFTLPANGEYLIEATHFIPDDGTPASTGAYLLTLEYVDPTTAGISPLILPIASGETISNTVTDEQYLLFYSFEGNGGDLVTIDVKTLSGDLDGVLYLYTYTSAGEPVEIWRNDDSPRGGTFDPLIENFALPRTATYLIAVGRYPDSTSTGEFAMTLTVTPPAP